ncbi:hypothetical protein [Actinophytocola xanthii]|uniref:hypothetical protein n=1 Tax=Actinophytocola xanthii TaxID=1912961 RepID=UPI001177E02C|nr:hypothetical protein [Actinophytocola xanthii]
MLLAELQEELIIPRKIKLSHQVWIAAAILGFLRTAINDEYRRTERDRGRANNIMNDLQGALGELVGLELLERSGLWRSTAGLLDLYGSVNGPDLVTNTTPPTMLDVKCHFDEPRKRLFLINERARRRSISRGVVAFLPIATASLHRNAYLGSLIPIEQLEEWELKEVGRYGDASRQITLVDLDRRFLGNHNVEWRTENRVEQWGASDRQESYAFSIRRTCRIFDPSPAEAGWVPHGEPSTHCSPTSAVKLAAPNAALRTSVLMNS